MQGERETASVQKGTMHRVREDMKGIERGSEGYNGNYAVIKSV